MANVTITLDDTSDGVIVQVKSSTTNKQEKPTEAEALAYFLVQCMKMSNEFESDNN